MSLAKRSMIIYGLGAGIWTLSEIISLSYSEEGGARPVHPGASWCYWICLMIRNVIILEEPKIREPLYFSWNLVLHFRRNGNRFREQSYAISSSVCPTCVVQGLLRVEVTPDIEVGMFGHALRNFAVSVIECLLIIRNINIYVSGVRIWMVSEIQEL